MHFEPTNDTSGVCSRSVPFVGNSDESKALYINNVMINEVTETKFLGVVLDNKLNWLPHIKYLVKKLRSAAAALCRIRHWIPKDKYLTVYHALFESHLTYGITVWGGVSNVWMDEVFKIQKHCVRVLFGDLEMYLDKSRTCVRARPYTGRGSQKLGKEYYCKEHTKKLFNHHNILAHSCKKPPHIQLLHGNFQNYEIQKPNKLIRDFGYFPKKQFNVAYYTTTLFTIFLFRTENVELCIQENTG